MDLDITVRGPSGASPPRAPGSVRRTTTIDMTWADGWGTELRLEGRGRDLLTSRDGSPVAVTDHRMDALVGPGSTIVRIETTPERAGLDALTGVRSGSGFRAALAERLPSGWDDGTPSALMLDDIPGATLISGFAFSRWHKMEELISSTSPVRMRKMEGICTGFMPGSSALAPDGTSRWTHRTQAVQPLGSADDASAWHEVPRVADVSMRRARRIDVRRDGDRVLVDAMFQDSATTPEGGRDAVHEYTLTAEADLATMTLTSVTPVPRVLPYAECPLAARNAPTLVGTPLADLRAVVLDRLQGDAGCTHLNDALRALADVPHLVGLLGSTDLEEEQS